MKYFGIAVLVLIGLHYLRLGGDHEAQMWHVGVGGLLLVGAFVIWRVA